MPKEEKKTELCNSSTQTSGLSEVSSEAEEHDIFVTLTNTRGTQTSRRESLLIRHSPDLKELYAMSRKVNEELNERLQSLSISKRESKSARRRLSFGETDLNMDDGPLASQLADISIEENEFVPLVEPESSSSRKSSCDEMDQHREDQAESTTENSEELIEATTEELQETTTSENLEEEDYTEELVQNQDTVVDNPEELITTNVESQGVDSEIINPNQDTVDNSEELITTNVERQGVDSEIINPEESIATNVEVNEVDFENPTKSSKTDVEKMDSASGIQEESTETGRVEARISEARKHDGRRHALVMTSLPGVAAGPRKQEKPPTWHKKEQALRRNLIVSPIKKRMKIDLPGPGWSNNLQEFRNLVPPLSGKKAVERPPKETEEHQVLQAMATVPSRAEPPKPVLRTKHGLPDEWSVPGTTTAQHFRHPEQVEREERRSRSRSPLARSQ